jgi:hypothetical protein
MKHPVTPDGRCFVVRGRLRRMANPGREEAERADLVGRLMAARQAVRVAKKADDREAEAAAHVAVDDVKRALGERGPAWWDVGWPDFNRHVAKNTPYADWYAGLARFGHGGLLVAESRYLRPGRHASGLVGSPRDHMAGRKHG